MPTPNFTASPTPPTALGGPVSGLDYWFDTTNQVLNVWTNTNTLGRQGWLPITSPAVSAALNASVVSVGPGQFDYIPAVVGSLGVSLPAIPAGQVGLAYDIVGQRLYVVGSGGVVTKSVLFA